MWRAPVDCYLFLLSHLLYRCCWVTVPTMLRLTGLYRTGGIYRYCGICLDLVFKLTWLCIIFSSSSVVFFWFFSCFLVIFLSACVSFFQRRLEYFVKRGCRSASEDRFKNITIYIKLRPKTGQKCVNYFQFPKPRFCCAWFVHILCSKPLEQL